MNGRLVVAAAAASISLLACGTAEIAPPRAPVPELPRDVEPRTTAPEAGTTRMIIDANGERATVVDVVERQTAKAEARGITAIAEGETLRPVCVVPCVVDLKPGMHVLRFVSEGDPSRKSEANVQIGERPKILRHAIGRDEDGSVGHFLFGSLATLGIITTLTGALLYGLGALDPSNSAAEDMKAYGAWMGGGGIAAAAIGIPLALLTRPVHQAGSTTQLAWR